MADKAHDLLEQNRVALVAGNELGAAVVAGQTGWYRVTATPKGLKCSCPVPAGQTCSHALAASAIWRDYLDDRPDREAEREAREYHDPDIDRDPLETIYEPNGWPE